MIMVPPENIKNESENLLTGIRDAYTLAATNEVEAMIIKHFLNTLAEVALAIASRKAAE